MTPPKKEQDRKSDDRSDPRDAFEQRVLDSLSQLESRVDILSRDLREMASLIARLKLMADNAKDRDRNQSNETADVKSAVDRIENLLRGRSEYVLDDRAARRNGV
ncbi:MAG: hypothetical protein AAGJ87_13630 [Pseudomonadota bacterium]